MGEGLDFNALYKGRETGKRPVVIVACVDTQQQCLTCKMSCI